MAARQALEDFCKQRGWGEPVYINLHSAASPGHQPTAWWAWADPTQSPFWRTLRCRDSDGRPCFRGDKCAFAHTDAELRPKPPRPTADDTFFLYEVAVRADHGTVRARGDEVTPHKSYAKEAASNKLLHQLLDELESLPPPSLSAPPRKPASTAPKPPLDPVLGREIESWLIGQVTSRDALCENAGNFEQWFKALGSVFAAQRPDWLAAVRASSHVSFRSFVLSHPRIHAEAKATAAAFAAEGRRGTGGAQPPQQSAWQGQSLPESVVQNGTSTGGAFAYAAKVVRFLTTPAGGYAAAQSGRHIRISYSRGEHEGLHPAVEEALAGARDGLSMHALRYALDAAFAPGGPHAGALPATGAGGHPGGVKMLCLALYISRFTDVLELDYLDGNTERPAHARLRQAAAHAAGHGGAGEQRAAAAVANGSSLGPSSPSPPPPPPPLPPAETAEAGDAWPTVVGLPGLAAALHMADKGAGPKDGSEPPPPPPGSPARSARTAPSADASPFRANGGGALAAAGGGVSDGQVEQLRAKVCELESELEELKIVEEFSLCQMCLKVPRDSLVLPCMDFLYCSRCLHGARVVSGLSAEGERCPACKGPVAGVLECRLSV